MTREGDRLGHRLRRGVDSEERRADRARDPDRPVTADDARRITVDRIRCDHSTRRAIDPRHRPVARVRHPDRTGARRDRCMAPRQRRAATSCARAGGSPPASPWSRRRGSARRLAAPAASNNQATTAATASSNRDRNDRRSALVDPGAPKDASVAPRAMDRAGGFAAGAHAVRARVRGRARSTSRWRATWNALRASVWRPARYSASIRPESRRSRNGCSDTSCSSSGTSSAPAAIREFGFDPGLHRAQSQLFEALGLHAGQRQLEHVDPGRPTPQRERLGQSDRRRQAGRPSRLPIGPRCHSRSNSSTSSSPGSTRST